MRARHLPALALVPALAVVGCSGTDPDPGLTPFDSCEALEQAIVEQAEEEIRWRFNWQFPWQGGGSVPPILGAPMGEDAAMSGAPGGAVAGRTYSDTNVQVEGIDEPDLVETDGTLLLTIAGDHLVISRAWPADQVAELGRLAIEGTPHGMMYRKDVSQVVVVSELWWNTPRPLSGQSTARLSTEQATAKITVIDTSDPAAPTVVRESYVQGRVHDARLIDDRLYLATYAQLAPPALNQASDKGEANEIARGLTLDDWMPWRLDAVRGADGGWETSESEVCGCTDVYGSERRSGNFMVTVSALDLDDPAATVAGTAVLGSAAAVYANAGSLFVAGLEDEDGPWTSQDPITETIVHKFDITAAGAPVYAATGKVPGHLLNQFSMDELDGRLRIATTDTDAQTTSSGVYVLEQSGTGLSIVGSVTGLAPDERIFAVRFMGDVAYVVTFVQQMGDPLFTIDLADPTAPVVRGALDVPGFSNYLHPFGDGRLLAVGQAGNWGGGVQVSIFDVRDLDNPVLEDRLELPDAFWSEAQDTHHAFNYFPQQQVLVLPVSFGEGSRMLVLHAAPGEDLSELGRLSQDAVLGTADVGDGGWCTGFRRSVIIENVLYATSNAGVTIAGVQNPGQVLASLPFDGVDYCGGTEMRW